MPRQARVDVPGQYCHVMSRGIERGEIFSQNEDYTDFLGGVSDGILCGDDLLAHYGGGPGACSRYMAAMRERAAARARAIYCYLCREQGGVGGTELMEELKINQSAVSKLISKGRALLGAIN